MSLIWIARVSISDIGPVSLATTGAPDQQQECSCLGTLVLAHVMGCTRGRNANEVLRDSRARKTGLSSTLIMLRYQQ